ncbi:MAG: hypothetical protein QNJ45_02965 [Ardenticatenaceae bacterium]|nr:hypothetical protein [Ardenticatenaceae bacterium]
MDQSCILGPQHAAADPSSLTGNLAVKHSIIQSFTMERKGLEGDPTAAACCGLTNWRCSVTTALGRPRIRAGVGLGEGEG